MKTWSAQRIQQIRTAWNLWGVSSPWDLLMVGKGTWKKTIGSTKAENLDKGLRGSVLLDVIGRDYGDGMLGSFSGKILLRRVLKIRTLLECNMKLSHRCNNFPVNWWHHWAGGLFPENPLPLPRWLLLKHRHWWHCCSWWCWETCCRQGSGSKALGRQRKSGGPLNWCHRTRGERNNAPAFESSKWNGLQGKQAVYEHLTPSDAQAWRQCRSFPDALMMPLKVMTSPPRDLPCYRDIASKLVWCAWFVSWGVGRQGPRRLRSSNPAVAGRRWTAPLCHTHWLQH